MDKYLAELTNFYEFTDEFFCSLILDDPERSSKEGVKDGHFSLRSFQALKSKKSDMLHSYHVKEILKKFALLNIDEECCIHKEATELAEAFSKISRDTTSIYMTPYNMATQDPSWWLDKIECNDPDIDIEEFKIKFRNFLLFGSGFQYSRPSYCYLLFLYKWLCIKFKNENHIDYKYIKKKISNPNDQEGQLIRNIIKLIRYSDDDIDALSNKALGKIASSINCAISVSDFVQEINKNVLKDIKECMDYLALDYSVIDKEERDEMSTILGSVYELYKDISESIDPKQVLDQFFKKVDNVHENLKDESLGLLKENFLNPLNSLFCVCLNANIMKIQRDIYSATNKFHIFSLLGQYNIDTTSLISDLEKYGPTYVIDTYIRSHKGYLWWKLNFDRAYNRYLFPSWFINEFNTCKMAK